MVLLESNLTIQVRDMDKSIAFYQSIGLSLKDRWGNHYAQLTGPGLVIGLHPSKADSNYALPGHISIGFTVDKFDEAKTFLQNHSIDYTERKESGGIFLHFSDPDGTPIYLIDPKQITSHVRLISRVNLLLMTCLFWGRIKKEVEPIAQPLFFNRVMFSLFRVLHRTAARTWSIVSQFIIRYIPIIEVTVFYGTIGTQLGFVIEQVSSGSSASVGE